MSKGERTGKNGAVAALSVITGVALIAYIALVIVSAVFAARYDGHFSGCDAGGFDESQPYKPSGTFSADGCVFRRADPGASGSRLFYALRDGPGNRE